MSTYKVVYFDTETTGISTDKDHIIELAGFNPDSKESFSSLISSPIPNPPESVAVNKITNEMLKDAPPFVEVAKKFIDFCSSNCLLIAHNCTSFDKPILENAFRRSGIEMPQGWFFLDTLKWARKYRADLPRHTLQYLREVYGIEANNAHRALDDVMTLYHLFTKMIDDLSYDQVIELLENKKSIEIMPFGKYKGTPLKDVPLDYIGWMNKNGVFDKGENKELKELFNKLGMLT